METITLTATKQVCYDVRVRYDGIRKKARKSEAHTIKLLESVAPKEIIDPATSTMRPQAYEALKASAMAAIQQHAREVRGKVTLHIDEVERSREEGFISTSYEPFSGRHIRIALA